MANGCPILKPEQRKSSETVNAAQRAMMEKVHAPIAEAAAQVREKVLTTASMPLQPTMPISKPSFIT